MRSNDDVEVVIGKAPQIDFVGGWK